MRHPATSMDHVITGRPEWLREIVCRASTLRERLDGAYRAAPDGKRRDVDRRLRRWQERVGGDQVARWSVYLAASGIAEAEARAVLGDVEPGPMTPWPNWADMLAEVVAEAGATGDGDEDPPVEAEVTDRGSAALRFAALLRPFVRVGIRRLKGGCDPSALALLDGSAWRDLEGGLLSELAGIASQTFDLEFQAFRSARRFELHHPAVAQGSATTRLSSQAFIAGLRADGLVGFFRRYPVLGRLMSRRLQLWIDSMAEFLERLAADRPLLGAMPLFPDGGPCGRVGSLRTGLSDPHNGGRSVVIVSFADGTRWVYKPHDLALERDWFQLLAWLNQKGFEPRLKVLRVLSRGTHGWVEYIEQKPAESLEDVRRFYYRAGAQLALLYCLHGTDLHFENVIACGDHPVVVDHEMLLQHRMAPSGGRNRTDAEVLAAALLASSVLGTGLLPRWSEAEPGHAADVSGLGAAEDAPPRLLPGGDERTVDPARTDRGLPEAAANRANRLLWQGTAQMPSAYAEDIVGGFTAMYDRLIALRPALTSPGGVWRAFADQMVRFVFRPTRYYFGLLRYSLHPRFLHDGVDRSIELDVLAQRFFRDDGAEVLLLPLLATELKAVEQLDIPILHARSDERRLAVGDGSYIENCFREPSFDFVQSRLAALDAADCASQTKMIRNALYCCGAPGLPREVPAADRFGAPGVFEPLSRRQALAEAMTIADDLCGRAIAGDDGSATWLGLQLSPELQRWQIQPVGRDLYGGSCGIALFLAAAYRVAGNERYRDLALAALRPVRNLLRDPEWEKELTKAGALGGTLGLGAHCYSLVRIARMAEAGALMEDAARLARLVTPAHVEADTRFDVMAGAAGAILGLLVLHDSGLGDGALSRACWCGDHLLRHRRHNQSGYRAWKTVPSGERHLTGFCHGAAGIALALFRLGRASGDQRYHDAAREAVDYERAVFRSDQGNWPDLRALTDAGEPGFQMGWCSGAPGIGLARLESLELLNDAVMLSEIEVAASTTMAHPIEGRDHLCCGNIGRCDVLLELGRRLNRPELELHARRLAGGLLLRSKSRGYRLMDCDAPDAFVPGLFQGVAGVGYGLLRLAAPEKVPSVLAWD